MVIGFNVLEAALNAIGRDGFSYLKFEGQQAGPSGFKRQTFAAPVVVLGSVQPMNSKDVMDRGLTDTESYIVARGSLTFLEGGRDVSSDQVEFSGDKYQVISVAPWNGQNGWSMAVCQKIRENHGT